ncbi:SDR family NAD(P)-dependent oxidoreductase [Halomarina oriensis]|uniref:Glucose 1-dehydrogenase n=1 Tax=Halomarina oriensis TaxID=671145 RepID=A0A6B0GGY1_9EURY|nr:SDR family oxidoreductase [Halomarina oriensis]MWG33820.1 glucose 1-dehydrogenase [Halomarina oriensis]
MQTDLSDSVALVTGAGRGNGRAIAERLATNGASVVVNDLDSGPAEETVERIDERSGEAIGIACDVSDESAVQAMVERGTDQFGTIDIVVNNAGVGQGDRFRNEPDDTFWNLNLDTHLRGAIYCTKHALDGMVEQGYGKVVNITSIHTKNGVGMSPQYDVAKFALLGLTKTLALELGRDGIRVNAVAPGWTDTRMTADFEAATREQILDLNPLGRFARSAEIADAVQFLCAPASDYVNGHELRVDGGQQPIDNWKHRYGDA